MAEQQIYAIKDNSGVTFKSDGTIIGPRFEINIKEGTKVTAKKTKSFYSYKNHKNDAGLQNILIEDRPMSEYFCDGFGNRYVGLRGVIMCQSKAGGFGFIKQNGNIKMSTIKPENYNIIFSLTSGQCYRQTKDGNVWYTDWSAKTTKENTQVSKQQPQQDTQQQQTTNTVNTNKENDGSVTHPEYQAAKTTNTPSLQQVYKEIAQFKNNPKGWAVAAKEAGWDMHKINLYRAIINGSQNKNAANSVNKQIGFGVNEIKTQFNEMMERINNATILL